MEAMGRTRLTVPRHCGQLVFNIRNDQRLMQPAQKRWVQGMTAAGRCMPPEQIAQVAKLIRSPAIASSFLSRAAVSDISVAEDEKEAFLFPNTDDEDAAALVDFAGCVSAEDLAEDFFFFDFFFSTATAEALDVLEELAFPEPFPTRSLSELPRPSRRALASDPPSPTADWRCWRRTRTLRSFFRPDLFRLGRGTASRGDSTALAAPEETEEDEDEEDEEAEVILRRFPDIFTTEPTMSMAVRGRDREQKDYEVKS